MAKQNVRSIIEDLRDLGVDTVAILKCNPTEKQLQDMRDGLMRLRDATKVVSHYRSSENAVIPVFVRD